MLARSGLVALRGLHGREQLRLRFCAARGGCVHSNCSCNLRSDAGARITSRAYLLPTDARTGVRVSDARTAQCYARMVANFPASLS